MPMSEDGGWITLFRKSETLYEFQRNFKSRMLKVYDNVCFIAFLYKNKTTDLGESQKRVNGE